MNRTFKAGDVVEVTWKDETGTWSETGELWDCFTNDPGLGIYDGPKLRRAIVWPDGSLTKNITAIRVVAA